MSITWAFGSVDYTIKRPLEIEGAYIGGGLEGSRRHIEVSGSVSEIWQSSIAQQRICAFCLGPNSLLDFLFCWKCDLAIYKDRPKKVLRECRRRTLAQPKRKSKRLRKIGAASSAVKEDQPIESISSLPKAGVAT